MRPKATGNWIFFCNPQRWNIDDFLEANLKSTSYLITDWKKEMFHVGDLGVIRVAVDCRNDRTSPISSGIYAIVEVKSLPHLRGSFHMDFWNVPKPDISNRLCVGLEI